MIRRSTDLTVAFDRDQPGVLARAFEAVARAGQNVDAYAEIEGILHLVTSGAAEAKAALAADGFRVAGEHDVLVIDAVDQPGTVARIFRAIADAGVSVRFAYIGARNRLVMGTDDVARAAEALEGLAEAGPR